MHLITRKNIRDGQQVIQRGLDRGLILVARRNIREGAKTVIVRDHNTGDLVQARVESSTENYTVVVTDTERYALFMTDFDPSTAAV